MKPTPPLEKAGDLAFKALVSDGPDPLGLHGSDSWVGLPADNHLVDAGEVEVSRVVEEPRPCPHSAAGLRQLRPDGRPHQLVQPGHLPASLIARVANSKESSRFARLVLFGEFPIKVVYTACPHCQKKGVHRKKLHGVFIEVEVCRYCRRQRTVAEFSFSSREWKPVENSWW